MVSLKKATKAATKKSLSTKDMLVKLKQSVQVLVEHSGFVLLLLLIVVLGYAVLNVGSALNAEAETTDAAPSSSGYVANFDPITRKKIDELNSEQTPTEITLPAGRINPFSE
jgi:hypothetical protein